MGGESTKHKKLSNNKGLWRQAGQQTGEEMPGQRVGPSRDSGDWPKRKRGGLTQGESLAEAGGP